jgi:hypothetical protein
MCRSRITTWGVNFFHLVPAYDSWGVLFRLVLHRQEETVQLCLGVFIS